MPDITPRLGLTKPKPQESVDVGQLNTNSDIIDNKYSTILIFPDATARDTAFAGKPFDFCYVGTNKESGTPYVRRGGIWLTMGGGPVGPVGPRPDPYYSVFMFGGM